MNTDPRTEVWADVRHYWRTRDLPMLLAEAGDAVVKRVAEKMEERRALDALVSESERLGLYGPRWSMEDEG